MIKTEKNFSSFSPFSPAMMWEKRNRALLIQFLISELIATYRGLCRNAPLKEILSFEKRFFPYDWAYSYGHLNKMREHARILEYVFPEFSENVLRFNQLLDKNITSCMKKTAIKKKLTQKLPEIFFALEPFIEGCKNNENLIFFLLKHKEEIDECTQKGYVHSFLLRLYPISLSDLCEKLCDNYHHRGFYFLIPEIKTLISKV